MGCHSSAFFYEANCKAGQRGVPVAELKVGAGAPGQCAIWSSRAGQSGSDLPPENSARENWSSLVM